MDLKDLTNRFTYHPPQPGQPELYQAIREKGLELATLIDASQPDGREKATAITNVEQAVMWANAGVARNG